MQTYELSAKKRELFGKGPNRRLRSQGFVPAVVYGKELAPLALTVAERDFDRILRTKLGMNTLIDLQIENDNHHKVLIKDYQGHAVNRRVKHIDFFVVDENQEVAISIPAHFVGKAKGLAQGGVLDVKKHEIDLLAQVGKIPEEITIDVTDLGVGDNIHLSDITLPAGVRPREGYNPTLVAMISITEEEIAPAPAAEGAEAAAPAAEGDASAEEKKES